MPNWNQEVQPEEKKAVETEEADLDKLYLPLIVIGNKCDSIDQINDELLIDYMASVMRRIAAQNNAFLVYLSSKQNINIKRLLCLLEYCLLNKENPDSSLETSFGIKNLFIPPGTDSLSFLSRKFKRVQEFTVPKEE